MSVNLVVNANPSQICVNGICHTTFVVGDFNTGEILSPNNDGSFTLNPTELYLILYSGQIAPITYITTSSGFYNSLLFAIQIKVGFDALTYYNLDHFVISAIGNQTQEVPFSVTISACDSNGNVLDGTNGRDDFNAMCAIISTLITIANTIPNNRQINPPFIKFVNGVWSGQLVVENAVSNFAFFVRGGSISSESNEFNVS